jgi:FkbM family methyltransferase
MSLRHRFRHLWTDQEIESGASFAAVLARNARECATDMAAAARAGCGAGRVRAPMLVLCYFAGMALRPLQSPRIVSLDVRGPRGPVPTVVRLSQSDVYIWREIFLEGIYDFPYGPVRTVVDLGANAGLAATWYSSRFPEAQIVCVEPMAENVAVIHEARRRSARNWEIEQAAIDSASGTTSFYSSEWWSSGSALEHIGHSRQDRDNRIEHETALPVREVPAISMTDLVDRHDLERIDVLKVDVEGAEEAVLCEGDTGWLERVRCIIVEIHDKYVDGDRVRRAVLDAGFEERDHHGPCSVFVAPERLRAVA